MIALPLAAGVAVGLGVGSWPAGALAAGAWASAPAIGRRTPASWWDPVVLAVAVGLPAAAIAGLDLPRALLAGLAAWGFARRASSGPGARLPVLLAALMLVVASAVTSSAVLAVGLLAWGIGAPAALGGGRAWLAPLVALAALPPFLLVPRLAPVGPVDEEGRGLTGFDDDVELGALRDLLDDPEPVLVARFSPPIEEVPYFRGVALDRFDGRRWWTESRRRPEPDWAGLPDSARIDVELEAHPEGVLFVAGTVDGLDARGVRVERDLAGSYHLPGPARSVRYTVFAQAGQGFGLGRADPFADAPPTIELPPLDPAVRALFAAQAPPGGSPAEVMDALARWVRADFSYTRQPRDPDPEAPLARFLLADRRGHCEYFASALAVGGRALGVPTRVVNGFLGGERRPDGSFVVRRYHAHSWVEYFDGQRWVTADATPPVGAPSGPGALVRAREALDSAWEGAVLGFDARAQLAPARGVARAMEPWTGPSGAWIAGIAAFGLSIGGALLLARSVERVWVARLDGGAPPPVDPVTRLLRDAQGEVRRAGHPLPPGPDVDAVRALADPELAAALEALAWASYAVRFGGEDPARHLERARALAALVTKRLREVAA